MLSIRARLFWVAECIHGNVAKSLGTFPTGDVGVFVKDVEEIQKIAAEADDFWRRIWAYIDVAGKRSGITDPSLWENKTAQQGDLPRESVRLGRNGGEGNKY